MTHQDAEAMAARLTRIWAFEHQSAPQWMKIEGVFDWRVLLSGDAMLALVGGEQDTDWEISLVQGDVSMGILWTEGRLAVIGSPPLSQGNTKSFSEQWMEFFRRGCWLSGCPIEATAHEKAQWMREFSREEVEAWNLKV